MRSIKCLTNKSIIIRVFRVFSSSKKGRKERNPSSTRGQSRYLFARRQRSDGRFTRELGQAILLGHAFAKIIRKLVLTWQMSNLDLASIKCAQNAVVKARTPAVSGNGRVVHSYRVEKFFPARLLSLQVQM